jgi:hypothetical protein
MTRHLTRLATGLVGTALTVALLVGPPWLLTTFVGSPLPSSWPDLDTLRTIATVGVTDTFVITTLAVIVWIAWAQLAVAIVIETSPRSGADRPSGCRCSPAPSRSPPGSSPPPCCSSPPCSLAPSPPPHRSTSPSPPPLPPPSTTSPARSSDRRRLGYRCRRPPRRSSQGSATRGGRSPRPTSATACAGARSATSTSTAPSPTAPPSGPDTDQLEPGWSLLVPASDDDASEASPADESPTPAGIGADGHDHQGHRAVGGRAGRPLLAHRHRDPRTGLGPQPTDDEIVPYWRSSSTPTATGSHPPATPTSSTPVNASSSSCHRGRQRDRP